MRPTRIVAAGGLAIAMLLVASRGAVAQNPGPMPGNDPLARFLFPPELVMSNQQAIGLTDRQRTSIQQEIQRAMGKFTDLQMRMGVDEAQVLDQVDQILNTERELKKTQLSLMIRIKNTLTPEQQAKLNSMR